MSQPRRILLAFSGGLDTSVLVPWLKEQYGASVIAYCSDLGNAPDEAWLTQWAEKLGAEKFIFEDLKDRFCQDFVFPAARAGTVYQDEYLLGTSLGRPLIAERMAHFAKEFGADAIAHGATGKGNDQLRFERSWSYLVPSVKMIAPWRTWDFKGRSELMKYLSDRGFEVDSKDKVFSEDVNLLHRSIEGGILESPEKAFDPADIYQWVQIPSNASASPVSVEIQFEKGIPTKVNGQSYGPAAILEKLNELAGSAGVGVQDLVEERTIGIKSRGIYETPGGTLLHKATRTLKHLCWDRNLQSTARMLAEKWSELIYDGYWHTDASRAIGAFFDSASDTLTGSIGLKLEKGQILIESRKSPYSLYHEDNVSFESDELGLHQSAEGYARIARYSQWQSGKRDEESERKWPS